MPGIATVTINSKQWSVSVANTQSELVTGLSGLASMSLNTGMLFNMGSDQNRIDINMQQMLFPLDIIFIGSSSGVVGVLRNVQPAEDAYFQAVNTAGARYFLEVNAGEAEGVEVGDGVSIEGYVQPTVWWMIPAILAAAFSIPVLGAGIKALREEEARGK